MIFTGQHWLIYAALAVSAAALILVIAEKTRFIFGLLVITAILISLYILGRGWLGGALVLIPVFEGPYFIPLIMCVITLFLAGNKNRALLPVLAGTTAALLFTCLYSRGIIAPTPQKETIWAILFLIAENSAIACFIAGGFAAVTQATGKEGDDTFHKIVTWGFIFYSIAQIVGAWWCFVGWGNTFSWGPRHMTSAFIWLTYAAYIHLRFIPDWTVRKRAIWAAAAGAMVIITTYGHSIHEMTFSRIGGLL